MNVPPDLAAYAVPERLALPRKLALAAEVVTVHAQAGRALRRHDLRTAIARLRRGAPDTDGADAYAAAVRLGGVVTRVLTPLPLDSSCLRLSLVLCAMLARRGCGSSIVIGVKGGSSFGAHAWVEIGERPVLPAPETGFDRLVAL